MSRFVRFQGVEPSVRGIHVGVFGLVNVLGRGGRLSEVPAADHLVEATRGHLDILDAHDVAWERVESEDPGRVATRTTTRSWWFLITRM